MSKRTVIITRPSRGLEVKQKVQVDEDRAQELVDNGLAKYAPHSKAADKPAS